MLKLKFKHRLLCADSTIKDNVYLLMDNNKADMVFTDPPYDFETKGGGIFDNYQKMIDIKNLKIDKFNPDILIKEYADTHVYFCNRLLIKKYIELSENWKVNFDLAIAHKINSPPNWGGHLRTDIEYIFIIGKQDPNQGLDSTCYSKLFSGSKNEDDEMSVGWSKPVALCEKFIKLYSNKIVLDLFMGAGSTLIACEKTNHNCYGIEINPYYCQLIIERYLKYTGNDKVFIINDNKIIKFQDL